MVVVVVVGTVVVVIVVVGVAVVVVVGIGVVVDVVVPLPLLTPLLPLPTFLLSLRNTSNSFTVNHPLLLVSLANLMPSDR